MTLAARKTFSGSTQRRKTGPRHPCGKLVQPTREEREADIRGVVIDQRHRFGAVDPNDPMAGTLIGRLLGGVRPAAVTVEGMTGADLHVLAQRFQDTYRRYQAALASRRAYAVTGGGALRPEPDPVAEQRAIDAWAHVCRCLRVHSERVEKAMIAAVIDASPDMDQRTLAPWIILSLPLGFRALGEAYS